MISVNDLSGFKLQAEDGRIGSVKDVLFEDNRWLVRHLVVDTGGFLFGKKVMLEPSDALLPLEDERIVPVRLSKWQVKNSPDVMSDPPRSHDIKVKSGPDALRTSGSGAMIGNVADPTLIGAAAQGTSYAMPSIEADPHLRSAHDIEDYDLMGADALQIGKVTDFVIDAARWSVPLAVIRLEDDNRHEVLMPTSMVLNVGWPQKVITTELTPSMLLEAPLFDPDMLGAGLLPAVESYYKRYDTRRGADV